MNGAAAIATAFAAGVLSSASPCVIAAVPVTIGFVGSRSTSRRQALLLSFAFVAGMTLAFVLLGLVAARLGLFFGVAGGWWVVIVGLVLAAAGVWFWKYGEQCSITLHPSATSRLRGSGWVGAAGFGALTGTVMTPCATPALAAALGLAGTGAFLGQATWMGAAMLFAYGLGHSALLFVAGIAPTYAQTLMGRLGRFERWLPGQRTFAGILVIAGLWIASSGVPMPWGDD
jgi:cytochrome c-type biogenesis protein